jgi:hypothetical protein
MLLKIALPILIFIVAWLTAVLDYEWVDKRFRKRKHARWLLFGSFFILFVVSVVAGVTDEIERRRTANEISGLEGRAQQAEAGNRDSVERLLDATLKEMVWNVEIALKNKSSFAYSLATGPSNDERSFRYELAMISSTPFKKNVPKVYDLKLLWAYGGKGERAFQSIENAYSRIEWAEKEEADIIRLIEKERSIANKKQLCGTLSEQYGAIQADLEKTEADVGAVKQSLPKN